MIELDEDAEQLFRELGGLDSARKLESFAEIADLLADCLKVEEERLDKWRVQLVEIAHLVSSYFVDVRFSEGIRKKTGAFDELLGALTRLSSMPDRRDSILIKFRGQAKGGKIPAKIDYVATFGNLVVDMAIARAMFNRIGLRMTHLTGRISNAFEVFSEHGVNTLFIRLPGNNYSRMSVLEDSLDIVSRFDNAVNQNRPIIYTRKGKRKIVLPVRDENGVPDPNLTLVSALNGLSPEFMKKLVVKIHGLMQSAEEGPDNRHVGIFDAIFSVPSLQKKLVRPPVELNNIKWLITDDEKRTVPKEKAVVARHVMNKVSGPAEKKSRVLASVYGEDYGKIDSGDFGERIGHVAELMDSLENDIADEKIQNEVMENVRNRFQQVREEIFDDLFLSGRRIEIRSQGRVTIVEKANEKLQDMLSFFKGRATARKKIKSMTHEALEFTKEDYENIAMDFDVSFENAEKIITLFRSCFDESGRFRRAEFEKFVPAFAKFEEKVFDILWHFLKITPDRKDRIAFLNSLQLLISKMKLPEKAIKVLLYDICQDPENISYSERNAFMLASLLVRSYNQELRLDIEITPEEVLDVRNGINRKAIDAAASMIEADSETYLTKIKTIHARLLKAIASDGGDDGDMPVRFLLSLEREACIFFALVQGNTARSILRSAVRGYGDPTSDLYVVNNAPSYLRSILQHLKVMIRALGRLEDEEAMELFNEIRLREAQFYGMGSGPQHESLVDKVMERVQIARKAIHNKVKG